MFEWIWIDRARKLRQLSLSVVGGYGTKGIKILGYLERRVKTRDLRATITEAPGPRALWGFKENQIEHKSLNKFLFKVPQQVEYPTGQRPNRSRTQQVKDPTGRWPQQVEVPGGWGPQQVVDPACRGPSMSRTPVGRAPRWSRTPRGRGPSMWSTPTGWWPQQVDDPLGRGTSRSRTQQFEDPAGRGPLCCSP